MSLEGGVGESGGVTAFTSRCWKEGGVKGDGDSAMNIYVGSFEHKGGKGLTGGIGWSHCGGEEGGGIIGGGHCEWAWSTSTYQTKKQPKDTCEEGTRFPLVERKKLLREVVRLQKSS